MKYVERAGTAANGRLTVKTYENIFITINFTRTESLTNLKNENGRKEIN